MISSKRVLGICLITATLFGPSEKAIAQERVLKVANWGEYIAEDTVSNFEADYGSSVFYET